MYLRWMLQRRISLSQTVVIRVDFIRVKDSGMEVRGCGT